MEALQHYDERREQLRDFAEQEYSNFVDEVTKQLEQRDSAFEKEQKELRDKVAGLEDKCRFLTTEYERLSAAHSRVLAKYQKEKGTIYLWRDYIEHFRTKQKKRHGPDYVQDNEPPMLDTSSPQNDEHGRANAQHASELASRLRSTAFPTPQSSAALPSGDTSFQSAFSAKANAIESKEIASSTQGTEDDVLEESSTTPTANRVDIPIEEHESPEIILVRTAQRGRNNRRAKASNQPGPSVYIKQETTNETQFQIPLENHMEMAESMDLDDVGPGIHTPRKRQRTEETQQSLDVEFISATSHQQTAYDDFHDRETHSHHANDTADDRHQPLSELTTNKKVEPRHHQFNDKKRKLIESDANVPELAKFSRAFAEDGVGFSIDDEAYEKAPESKELQQSENRPEDLPALSSRNRGGRLAGLLEQPAPRRNSLEMTSLPANAEETRERHLNDGSRRKSPPPRVAVTSLHVYGERTNPDNGRAQNPTTNEKLQQSRPTVCNEPKRRNRRQTRLRDLSPSSLSLSDFKVNPKANKGANYAFTETVRSRDQRRCLPGCTKPECCGDKFRKLVEIGGLPAPRGGNLRWDSQEDDADTKLLKSYLGKTYSAVTRMSSREKQEALTKARAQHLANEHGRHRHTFERAKTPPGFWRAEMPSSLELENDRLEALNEENRKVRERYREAMRDGGRWLFADEK